ncbi:hypothetical protein SOM10_17815 [Microbacterium sp. CFBP9023]|uniref:hypothetical protein n=1 Tax=Microbacterium sp. CFBP9023 TaxID=3096535 RepID=UPI002A6AA8E4|nr:hypothetical protein [Microbacterium sp. CFBP9023]MDY0985762.1 hypothetical protein [Microbacterium sp. CFBP9023]
MTSAPVSALPLTVAPRNEARSPAAQAIALGVTALIAMRVDVQFSLTAGGAVALVLAPLWFGTAVRTPWARVLGLLSILAVTSGAILTMVNSIDHTQLSYDLASRTVALLQLTAVVGFLVWSHRVTSLAKTSVAFAAGLAASIPLNVSDDPNIWRFTLSVPLGVFVLALCSLTDRLMLTLAAIGGLAIIGLLNDSRSNSAFLLLTGVVLIWQRLSVAGSRRSRGWGGVLSLAAAGILIAMLLQGAILEGYFGEVTQTRTAEQIARGGSVVVGGRPEVAASVALIERYPWGLGSGIKATYDDILAAKSGMAGIGYDPNNGYVERFMFGTGIEVHSVAGDFWIWFGLAGVAMILAVLVLLITAIKRGYVAGALTPLLVYLVIRAFWDIPFSPFDSALRLWPLTLSLAIGYACYLFARPRADLNVLSPRPAGRAVPRPKADL